MKLLKKLRNGIRFRLCNKKGMELVQVAILIPYLYAFFKIIDVIDEISTFIKNSKYLCIKMNILYINNKCTFYAKIDIYFEIILIFIIITICIRCYYHLKQK